MKRMFLAAALAVFAASPALADGAVVSAPPPVAAPQLSLEQKTMLRCSAAFAIIASEQARGIKRAQAYPPLAARGQEYFVQAGAQLMSQLNLGHDDVAALYKAEVKRLQDESTKAANPAAMVDAIMQPCLLSLDASGL